MRAIIILGYILSSFSLVGQVSNTHDCFSFNKFDSGLLTYSYSELDNYFESKVSSNVLEISNNDFKYYFLNLKSKDSTISWNINLEFSDVLRLIDIFQLVLKSTEDVSVNDFNVEKKFFLNNCNTFIFIRRNDRICLSIVLENYFPLIFVELDAQSLYELMLTSIDTIQELMMIKY